MKTSLAWLYSATVLVVAVLIGIGYVSGKYSAEEGAPLQWLQQFSLIGGVPLAFLFDTSNRTALHPVKAKLLSTGLVMLFFVLLTVITYVFAGDGEGFTTILGSDTGGTIFERMKRSEIAMRLIELGVVGLFIMMDREA